MNNEHYDCLMKEKWAVLDITLSNVTIGQQEIKESIEKIGRRQIFFLAMVPAILGAGLVSIKDVSDWQALPYKVLAVGFLAAAISGYFSVKYLLRYFSKHTLKPFAWYRIILGIVILIWVIFR